MPYVFSVSKATAGPDTAGTSETPVCSFKGSASGALGVQSFFMIGKANAAVNISGIAIRTLQWATGSTAGTACNALPKDDHGESTVPSLKGTAVSGQTIGTTRVNGIIFGCGKAGPGGWVAPNPDSVLVTRGTTKSLDFLSHAAEASLGFEWSCEVVE